MSYISYLSSQLEGAVLHPQGFDNTQDAILDEDLDPLIPINSF